MPYDLWVKADRPAACKSRSHAATGSTTSPAGSSSRHGCHTSPDWASRPTRTTVNDVRSRSSSSLSITDRDHNQPDNRSSPELHGPFR